MTEAILLRVGFGVLVLAMAFRTFVFARAWYDPEKREDRRYRMLSAALTAGSIGVGIWAFNPLSQSFGGPPLHPYLMTAASLLIMGAAAAIIGSTAIGGDPRTLRLFVLLSGMWAVGCVAAALLS